MDNKNPHGWRLLKGFTPPESYLFLRAAGYTHSEACEKLGICKGCYIPCHHEYCNECYATLMDDTR